MSGRHVHDELFLTDGDLEILAFIAAHRAVPFDVLIACFFRTNRRTEQPNHAPERTCARRLRALERGGFVRTTTIGSSPGTVTRAASVTSSAARILGTAPPRALAVRNRQHHVATVRAIDELRMRVEKKGGRLVAAALEDDLRSRAQRGRRTRAGQDYEAYPDAVVTVVVPRESGDTQTLCIAIEYVTAKYADADIRRKAEGFRRYDRTLWVADREATRARVERITGARCACR